MDMIQANYHNHVIYDDVLLVILDVVDCLFEVLYQRKDYDEMKKLNDFISDTMYVDEPPKQYAKKYLQFIRKIIKNEGNYLFKEDFDFISKLLNVVIRYCNNVDYDIRVHATLTFYLFIRMNFEVLGSVELIRINTIASIAYIENNGKIKTDYFKGVLNTLGGWLEDDLLNEKKSMNKSKDVTNEDEIIEDENIDIVERYKRLIEKKQMKLFDVIENEQNGGDRKYRMRKNEC